MECQFKGVDESLQEILVIFLGKKTVQSQFLISNRIELQWKAPMRQD